MDLAADLCEAVGELAERSDHRTLASNALACYYWNMGDLDSATRMMQRCRHSQGSVSERLHLLGNMAVLAGDLGHASLCRDVADEVKALARPGLDQVALANLNWALALADIAHGVPDRALEQASTRLREWADSGVGTPHFWGVEVLSEALLALGRGQEANRIWNRTQKIRRESGGRLTPRMEQRQAKLESCA